MKSPFSFLPVAFFLIGMINVFNANAQIIITEAGNGIAGWGGYGGPAISATMQDPFGVALDDSGNVFISDYWNNVVDKVSATSGIITRIAGTPGVSGYTGDGGQATSAKLYYPQGLAFDHSGNLYIADRANNVIRKVNTSTGIITTVAGDGGGYYGSDGVLATSTGINDPYDIAVDDSDNLYIADYFNFRIRKVTATTGIITTIAGNGTQGAAGDGGLATSAQLSNPSYLALDDSGNIYISVSNKIRKITVANGIITTIAGTGTLGFSGDGGQATSAQINSQVGVALDTMGNIYIADTYNQRIRKIIVSTGIISTIAGTGSLGYSGDGGLAASAQLNLPMGIVVNQAGCIYFDDAGNNVLRIIQACSGVGIDEHAESTVMNIFPNPTNGAFTLVQNENETLDVIIYDSLGQRVNTFRADSGVSQQINIETPGIYLIATVDSDGHRTSQRVMVSR